jgi:hypothetical protein
MRRIFRITVAVIGVSPLCSQKAYRMNHSRQKCDACLRAGFQLKSIYYCVVQHLSFCLHTLREIQAIKAGLCYNVDILNKQICGTGFFADKCLSRNKNITCRL